MLCTSAMSKPDSVRLRQDSETLGGEVVSSWSDRCSHLVMTNLTVTVKVAGTDIIHTLLPIHVEGISLEI